MELCVLNLDVWVVVIEHLQEFFAVQTILQVEPVGSIFPIEMGVLGVKLRHKLHYTLCDPFVMVKSLTFFSNKTWSQNPRLTTI